MEDWLAYVETFSAYLLFDLPWQAEHKKVQAVFEEQWSCLRRATLYALRHHGGQHTEERIAEAQRLFVKYGELVEQVLLACLRRSVFSVSLHASSTDRSHAQRSCSLACMQQHYVSTV